MIRRCIMFMSQLYPNIQKNSYSKLILKTEVFYLKGALNLPNIANLIYSLSIIQFRLKIKTILSWEKVMQIRKANINSLSTKYCMSLCGKVNTSGVEKNIFETQPIWQEMDVSIPGREVFHYTSSLLVILKIALP